MKINDSKFNMWRACVVVTWADGKISSEEKEWVQHKITELNFSEEQKAVLQEELNSPSDFQEIVSKITDKKDRAFLAYQIRLISHLDNDYSVDERALYESWHNIVMKGVELDSLVDEIDSYYETKIEVYNKSSLFERFHKAVLKYFQS